MSDAARLRVVQNFKGFLGDSERSAVGPGIFFYVVQQVVQNSFQQFWVSRDMHRIANTVESIVVLASIRSGFCLGNQGAQQVGG